MNFVATLIAGATSSALDAGLVAQMQALLPGGGAPLWLAQDSVVDLPFRPGAGSHNHIVLIGDVEGDIRAAIGTLPIDVVIQHTAQRRKRLLLADMDSTMIGQECIDELADYVGLKARVSLITERAMRGEIAFEPALRERVALLKGLPASAIETIIKERIVLTPGARTLIATMRAHGAYTCLVSGGFTAFTVPIAAMIGFDESRGNTLLLDAGGNFTGLVAEPILGRDAKADTLAELRARLRLSLDDTIAVGDGANDIPMIEAAGLGIAYRAKPKVAQAATARVDHADLTALLYAQGFRRDEFVMG